VKEIKERILLQRNIADGFLNISKDLEEKLYEIVIDELENYDRVNGRLVFSKDSSFRNLAEKLVKEFKDSTLTTTGIREIINNFDDIRKNTIKVGEMVHEIDFSKLKISDDQRIIIESISDQLGSVDSFKVNVVKEIERQIIKNVTLGVPIKELKSELSSSIKRSKTQGGILERYATQVTTDSVYQFTGLINKKINDYTGSNAIRYIGSIIENSRPQCIRWVIDGKGLILRFDKEGYYNLDDEVKWAKKNGKGYGKEGTKTYLNLTPENFEQIRGGYGCLHETIGFKFNEKSEKITKNIEKIYQQTLIDNGL